MSTRFCLSEIISNNLFKKSLVFTNIPSSRFFTPAQPLIRTYASAKKETRPIRTKTRGRIPGAVPLETAILILRSLSLDREYSTVELMLQYDRSKYNRELLASCNLPTPMARESKILVLAEGKLADEAKAAGAAIVGGPELLEKIVNEEVEFTRLLCTPDMFPHVIKHARFLGPKGLMPSVKKGSVTTEIVKAIKDSQGAFDFKSDPYGWIRVGIAKLNFSDKQIEENIHALIYSVLETVAPVVKNDCLVKLLVKSTMGPSLRVSDTIGTVTQQFRADLKKAEANEV